MPTMHGRSNESKEDPPNEKNGNLNNCLSVQGIIICMTVPNLKGSLPEERAQFGRSKRLCCNCLKLYQRVQHCRKKGACKDCGRKHSSLLPHPPVAGGNANKDQVPAGKQQENPPLYKEVNKLSQRSTMVLLKSSLHSNVKSNGLFACGARKGYGNMV